MHTILVVDDEPFVRLSMASLRLWQEDGYDFRHEAGNGQQALDILAGHPEIDIVLLDLSMPVMDGISFLKALPEGRRLAVVVLSAHDNFHLVRQAFTLGANDYVLKTEVDGDSLKTILDKVAATLTNRREESGAHLDNNQREFLVNQVLRDLLSESLPLDWESLCASLGFRLDFPLALWSVWINDFEAVAARYAEGELSRFNELFLRSVRQALEKRGGGQAIGVAKDQVAILTGPGLETALFQEELQASLERYLSVRIEIACSPPVDGASQIRATWEALAKRRSGSSRIVVMARRYLRDHFADTPVSLDQLAAHVGVSRNHLSWEFARETGETITDHLARLRVEEACRLLVGTTLKVYEISEKVGYPNVEHFCRVFKKLTGISPNRWASEGGPKVFREIRQ